MRRIVASAVERARFSGAESEVVAMAAVRATREATVEDGGERLPVIVGTPLAGERIGGEIFDGHTETAIFPGDLPRDPNRLFDQGGRADPLNFVRFRPPRLERGDRGLTLSLPHIRLDRAMQFLIGDRLA